METHKCSINNVIQYEDEYIYKCCNKILRDIDIQKYKNKTKLKFEKKIKKDYDIDYLLKNISNLKYQFINNEKAYEIKLFFKNNNYPHKNGDDIYKIMREDTNLKKIGVYYCNIFEMWTILNNIEKFIID